MRSRVHSLIRAACAAGISLAPTACFRPPTDRATAADSAAIARLHSADMQAVVAGDTATLMSLWTDDIVSLGDGTVRRGRAANGRALREITEQMTNVQPLDYRLAFEELEVRGDLAVEWGTFSSKALARPRGDTLRAGGTLMRLLKRQRDGSWKVWRTIFTESPHR